MEQLGWLEQLQLARADYLEQAREAAFKLLRSKDYITVDDVRKECPPPDNIDGRVMGAIFTKKHFESVGFSRSVRVACHHRPIQRFRLKGTEAREPREYGDTY
jgi:hypothetical protein